LRDRIGERGRGGGAGLRQLPLAGARLVEGGGELGPILVERRSGAVARLRDAPGNALLQYGERPFQTPRGELDGAVRSELSHGDAQGRGDSWSLYRTRRRHR